MGQEQFDSVTLNGSPDVKRTIVSLTDVEKKTISSSTDVEKKTDRLTAVRLKQ